MKVKKIKDKFGFMQFQEGLNLLAQLNTCTEVTEEEAKIMSKKTHKQIQQLSNKLND